MKRFSFAWLHWSRWSRWHTASMSARMTCLFAVIACLALSSVGLSLYDATRAALSKRADYQLAARVEHMRSLLEDLYTVQQIEARPALFETMMGDEQDIIVFRRADAAPFIAVNPQGIPLPAIVPVPPERPIRLSALHEGKRSDGLRMRWLAAQARVGGHGEVVEIIAAHVMTQEEKVLDAYRIRVLWTVVAAVLITALLTFVALRRGLRPLREMAEKTAEITPERLALRLDVAASPQELRQFAASFNAMLDRLASGYQTLMQFSADLAHEVRTPIGVLIGQTQVTLVHERSASDYRNVLESNLEELERLARIADNILFLAQADHGARAVSRVPLSIQDELQTIETYFEVLADERDLRFSLEASGTLHADPIMSRRAISNVVVNAVRYALPGTTIKLAGKETANAVVITIGNRGEPIAQAVLAKLFDRFYRADASRSAFTESSGLGLAIVRAIMLLHEGNAEIQCSEDGWIEVTLTFPNDRILLPTSTQPSANMPEQRVVNA